MPCLLSLLTRRGCCCLTHDRYKTMFSEAGEHQEVFALKQQKQAGRVRGGGGGGPAHCLITYSGLNEAAPSLFHGRFYSGPQRGSATWKLNINPTQRVLSCTDQSPLIVNIHLKKQP